jgi:3-hydroxyacyl-[acyl-carrier-protein] dehydratase
MAPTLLFEIADLPLDPPKHSAEVVEQVNPHRGAMRLLDAVAWEDETLEHAVAYHEVRDDEFWVPGHIPGRPLFPGVLMIEAAAQLASFISLRKLKDYDFLGFAGVDDVKFRGQVVPGDRLYVLMKQTELRRRRCICDTQAVVDGEIVFEGKITGMPM